MLERSRAFLRERATEVRTEMLMYSPQKGIPSGVHCPSSPHMRRPGPRSSNPRSQEYVATVFVDMASSEKETLQWAGAPGNLHFGPSAIAPENRRNAKLIIISIKKCKNILRMCVKNVQNSKSLQNIILLSKTKYSVS